jgi:hypothetical protein
VPPAGLEVIDNTTAAVRAVAGNRSERSAAGVTPASFNFRHCIVLTEIKTPPLDAKRTPRTALPKDSPAVPDSPSRTIAADRMRVTRRARNAPRSARVRE